MLIKSNLLLFFFILSSRFLTNFCFFYVVFHHWTFDYCADIIWVAPRKNLLYILPNYACPNFSVKLYIPFCIFISAWRYLGVPYIMCASSKGSDKTAQMVENTFSLGVVDLDRLALSKLSAKGKFYSKLTLYQRRWRCSDKWHNYCTKNQLDHTINNCVSLNF